MMTSQSEHLEELITGCQDLVRSLAWRVRSQAGHRVDIEDLIGYGQIGLAEAAKAFDPSRGTRFSTFAYYRIRGAIYDGVTLMSWFRPSDRSQFRYERMANEVLQVESDDAPSSESSSLEEDSSWFNEISASLAMVYLTSHRGDDANEESLQVADDSTPSPPAVVCKQELQQTLRALVDALPGQEGRLIRAAYYDGLSLKEAARRIGISKSWASRLHTKTLKQLARSLRNMGVVD